MRRPEPHHHDQIAVNDALMQVSRVVKFQSERDEPVETGYDAMMELLRDWASLLTAFYWATTRPPADPLARKGRADLSGCLLAVAATCVRWYMIENHEAAKDPRR